MKYEERETEKDESIFSFLPSLESECIPNNFKQPGCALGFWDSNKSYAVKIQDKTYSLSENKKIFEDWDLTGEQKDFYNITRSDIVSKL